MAKIIKANGMIEIVTPNEGCKELSLRQLHDAVGGYIELVPLDPSYGTIMFCNEDGLRLCLEMNDIASSMAGQTIVGNVILCEKDEVS
jgi:hypothetical protein